MEIIKGHRDGSVRSDEAVDKQALSLGIDIGSISSDVIVLDERGHVIFKDYRSGTAGRSRRLSSRLSGFLSSIRPRGLNGWG